MKQIYVDLSTLPGPLVLSLRNLSTIKPQKTYSVKKSVVRQRLLNYINTKAGQKELFFVTVTFPPSVNDATGYKALNTWLTRLRQLRILRNYLWVAERQESGVVHFHIAVPHRVTISKFNSMMKGTLKNLARSGEIPGSKYQFNKYNGVHLGKDKYTGKVVNFAVKRGAKSLAWYLTKYITKNDTAFTHLAWHNSRGFSSLWLAITFSKQEFDRSKLHYHLNFAKQFENDFVIFVPWRGPPPVKLMQHLYEVNSYNQYLLSNN